MEQSGLFPALRNTSFMKSLPLQLAAIGFGHEVEIRDSIFRSAYLLNRLSEHIRMSFPFLLYAKASPIGLQLD
jgi:hypothetical protein